MELIPYMRLGHLGKLARMNTEKTHTHAYTLTRVHARMPSLSLSLSPISPLSLSGSLCSYGD